MADIKYYDVILKPVITEKSMAAYGLKRNIHSWYITEANKTQIKEAVEKMFAGTKVAKRKHNELRRKEQRDVEHDITERQLRQRKQSFS